MRLTVLGSGTGIPLPDRGSPCYLLRTGDAVALVDSGPGALRQLARLGVSPAELTDLLYTHTHPDHTNDLWAFLFASRNPALGRGRGPLRLHGSPGFFDFYHRVARTLGSWVEPLDYAIELCHHLGQPVAVGAATVSGVPVAHIASSVAYRFEVEGKSLVFSGDTGYGEGIVAAARDADLLVLDCSTPDGQELEGHLTPASCGRIAAESGARRLLLSHFYPAALAPGVDLLEQLHRSWPGDGQLACDFLEIELG